jgi:hypothetical protein
MNYVYITINALFHYDSHLWLSPFWNGRRHLLVYFEDIERRKKHTNESLKKLATIIQQDFPAIFYAQDKNAFMKIEATQDQLNVYPLEPYCMKQGIDASEPNLDLEIYTKIALAFCENTAIYSLETKHLNASDEICP